MAKVRFELKRSEAQQVFLAGEFNEWDPAARRMRRSARERDAFVAVLELAPGRYEFKYVVDGEWVCCPKAPTVPNDHGTENSVVEVPG